MHEVLNEIVEKVPALTVEERRELIDLLNQAEIEEKRKLAKGFVSPNTIWVKENSEQYAGKYVALKDGKLVAFGKTIKEADKNALASGVSDSLLHYIPAHDEELSGGW